MGWIKDIFDMIMAMIRSDISDRETFFRNHVEPLYEKLIQIHKDYIKGFQEIRAKIQDGSFSDEELISFIRERRRDYAHERQLAQALAIEMKKAEHKRFSGDIGFAVEDYCQSILNYFSFMSKFEFGTSFSELISRLEANRVVLEWTNLMIEYMLP